MNTTSYNKADVGHEHVCGFDKKNDPPESEEKRYPLKGNIYFPRENKRYALYNILSSYFMRKEISLYGSTKHTGLLLRQNLECKPLRRERLTARS